MIYLVFELDVFYFGYIISKMSLKRDMFYFFFFLQKSISTRR